MNIFEKTYSGESLPEISRDIYEFLNNETEDIKTDQHGFPIGTFKVIINWEPNTYFFNEIKKIKQLMKQWKVKGL